jgi:predicted lipoprotein with Yx(FWY)xxD motif
MKPARTRPHHEAIGRGDLLVHEWRVAQLTRLGVTALANAKGITLYSFAPDTPTTSRCNGQCTKFWPPVKGPVTAGPGVPGTLGTITRSDGSIQATYDGHPLYTYVADTAPGQAKGNGLNVSGGVWHEVTASGAAAPSPSSGGSGSSGGGGYGY